MPIPSLICGGLWRPLVPQGATFRQLLQPAGCPHDHCTRSSTRTTIFLDTARTSSWNHKTGLFNSWIKTYLNRISFHLSARGRNRLITTLTKYKAQSLSSGTLRHFLLLPFNHHLLIHIQEHTWTCFTHKSCWHLQEKTNTAESDRWGWNCSNKVLLENVNSVCRMICVPEKTRGILLHKQL